MNKCSFMHQAIDLGYRGIGYTKSNPMVGCVVVQNEKTIGIGWHERYGEAHAEVNAIRDAEGKGYSISGAKIFVTLEPCFHQGKTPPCVDMLLQKKVEKVAVLFQDANPLTNGKSLEKLKKHGIVVDTDFETLRAECFDLSEDFFYHIRAKLPFVSCKMAMTADGYIGETEKRIRVTGPETREHTHFLRQRYDAILVGTNTVLIDNPHLGVRLGDFHQGKRDPLRIVFDPQVRLPKTSRVFRDENFLLVTLAENKKSGEKKFGKRVITVPVIDEKSSTFAGNVPFVLSAFLRKMQERKIASILVEGGAKTIQEFIRQRCVQKGYLFVSPRKLGTKHGVKGVDFRNLSEFALQRKKKFGEDVLWEGRMN